MAAMAIAGNINYIEKNLQVRSELENGFLRVGKNKMASCQINDNILLPTTYIQAAICHK